MNIRDILKVMVERNASDIYLTEGLPPMYRVEGVTQPVGSAAFTNEMLETLANDVMRDKQKKEFEENNEMNLALFYPDMGRFRVNIFRQRGNVGFVIRQIKVEIVPIDKLGLPPIVKDIIMSKRGLVLVVGATGSGKSTSLAAMIDHRNVNSPGHIITVEDPIEFVHRHKRSVITQREVGFDTMSFHAALKNTLRQAPDVILIGEAKLHQIPGIMQVSKKDGMQTMDMALVDLVTKGLITKAEAQSRSMTANLFGAPGAAGTPGAPAAPAA